jgi:hypothetical protein
MAGFTACGSGALSAVGPANFRYIANENQNTDAGNSAGRPARPAGSPVSMAWSNGSDYWGRLLSRRSPVLAVEVVEHTRSNR